ncbi:MAG: phosphoribosylamine--glycine ligase [Nitrospiria bacterium]
MKILVVGGGGREHALVWKIAQSPGVTHLFCSPGNAGMAPLAELVAIEADDVEQLLRFAKERRIDLTVVGPELPLSLGIVDRFESEGLRIFGPHRAAAELETSKVFSKALMRKYKIPTAEAEVVSFEEAFQRVPSLPMPVVLKVEGLAAGKGVVVATDRKEAKEGLEAFRAMGSAASRIILEEYLEGAEVSFFVVTDGRMALPLASSHDHKRVFDADRGPNTGGMGAVSPTPRLAPSVEAEIMSRIIYPTLRGLSSEGSPYRGVLYAGLMLTPEGAKVLEFNARWGDPEAQAILPRLNTDWVEVMEATLDHRLDQIQLDWKEAASVCVVLASEGYPGPYRKGETISGLENADLHDVLLFHAGTERRGEAWVTRGGRVLGVTALGDNLSEGRRTVYQTIGKISFPGMHYRADIGAPAG